MTRARALGRGSAVHDLATEAEVRAVYQAHFGRLSGWAAHLLEDRDLGHDVAAEAFVRLWKHWHQVEDPRPWLYATGANLVRDHWRKRGREARAYQRLRAGVIDPEQPEPTARGPVDLAQRISVREAVESLPERLRAAVLLHYYADISVAEVARQLGKSDGAVKRDLYDARGRLAELLREAR